MFDTAKAYEINLKRNRIKKFVDLKINICEPNMHENNSNKQKDSFLKEDSSESHNESISNMTPRSVIPYNQNEFKERELNSKQTNFLGLDKNKRRETLKMNLMGFINKKHKKIKRTNEFAQGNDDKDSEYSIARSVQNLNIETNKSERCLYTQKSLALTNYSKKNSIYNNISKKGTDNNTTKTIIHKIIGSNNTNQNQSRNINNFCSCRKNKTLHNYITKRMSTNEENKEDLPKLKKLPKQYSIAGKSIKKRNSGYNVSDIERIYTKTLLIKPNEMKYLARNGNKKIIILGRNKI